MAKPSPRSRLDTVCLILATTLGSLPIALLGSAALARFLPVSPDARFAIGFGLAIPSWLSVMCITVLAKSGPRALLACAALSAALAGVVFGVGFEWTASGAAGEGVQLRSQAGVQLASPIAL